MYDALCGVTRRVPEMYLNPLNVDVTSRSKHNIRPVLFLAFFMLMLYSRKRYRAWDKVERSTKDAADDHVIALLQVQYFASRIRLNKKKNTLLNIIFNTDPSSFPRNPSQMANHEIAWKPFPLLYERQSLDRTAQSNA